MLASTGGKVEGAAMIKEAGDRCRNAILAAIRNGWEQSAVDVLTEQLAAAMAKPCGTTKTRMAASLRRDAKKAAKAARPADDGDDDRDAMLEEMNERYALVMAGGSARVAEVAAHDPCLGRTFVRLMRPADFVLSLSNVLVCAPVPRDPARVISKGAWWLGHPGRRQHLGGITLDATGTVGPEYLNTWRGFAVEPVAGDPQVFLDHVAMITAGNGDGAGEYLLNWCAHKVQHPGEQVEVAVVMRGDEGTGKGGIGHAIRRIFGGHGMHISHGDHLVGKFNAHLMDCCFLYADEAFFAADPRHVNVLKSLITESTIAIERKFVDAFQGRNRLGVLMASNSDFVVPAGKDARRFFCVDVPDTRKGDRAYFRRYWSAVNDDARLGAFLKFLLERDLSGFEVRDFPQTEMLTEQKLATLQPHERWLLNRLALGRVVNAPWQTFYSTTTLHDDYAQEMRMNGQPRFHARCGAVRPIPVALLPAQAGGEGEQDLRLRARGPGRGAGPFRRLSRPEWFGLGRR